MFTFFHRTTKITLDCFTAMPEVYNCVPIIKTSRTIPDWWKSLPNPGKGNALVNPNDNNNMRRCYGFVELLKKGVTLCNWADMHLRVTDAGYKFKVTAGVEPGCHHTDQYQGAFLDWFHVKMHSPWYFREKTGVQFLFMGAEWLLDKYDFKVLPGVVEFQVNAATNVNIMVQARRDPYDIFLPAGQPLVQLIPLTENKTIEVKCHVVTDAEYSKIARHHITYRGIKEQLKLYKKAHTPESKCPFH